MTAITAPTTPELSPYNKEGLQTILENKSKTDHRHEQAKARLAKARLWDWNRGLLSAAKDALVARGVFYKPSKRRKLARQVESTFDASIAAIAKHGAFDIDFFKMCMSDEISKRKKALPKRMYTAQLHTYDR